MLRKKLFTPFFVMAFVFAAAAVSFAQTAPVSGRVEVKKADGTVVPAENAKVDCYRTDVQLGCRSSETNSRGEFTFLGIPFSGQVVLAVSGPGIGPVIYPGIKAGRDDIVITVSEGDGSVLDEAEVRRQAEMFAANPTGELTEEQKKAQEEFERQKAEIEAKNAKALERNAEWDRLIKEGLDAFNSGNYDVAVTKFQEGIEIDPTFVGAAPAFMNNKGAALKKRAVEVYNAGVKSGNAAQLSEAKQKAGADLSEALSVYHRSYEMLKGANAAEITDAAKHKANMTAAADGGRDAVRLMVLTGLVDYEKTEPAKTLLTAYYENEADKIKKAEAHGHLGGYLAASGDLDGAVSEYRQGFTLDPTNPDLVGMLGNMLFALADVNADDSLKQESLNYMDKFLKDAPKNHKLRAEIEGYAEQLKGEGLKPQKIN